MPRKKYDHSYDFYITEVGSTSETIVNIKANSYGEAERQLKDAIPDAIIKHWYEDVV